MGDTLRDRQIVYFKQKAEIKQLKKQNAELQKQMEELTKRNFELAEKGEKVCIAYKQSVKDTAKEIYNEINSCIEQGQEYCGLDWRGLLTAKTIVLVWCKKNGVEVE